MGNLKQDQPVHHERHGEGRVVSDLGETVVVRFGDRLEQVERNELKIIRSLADVIADGRPDPSLAVLARAQALLIRSINDQWGVFARSRLKLLPHQLWVCRQVTREWPARWLVADDVGLGKTIEAGLILTSLMASGRIRRLLILAPARLVPQWRARLKSMFDIRLQEYTREQDRGPISFWDTASQVVASFHTLRMPKARDKLLEAEPWDMVMVDEAHHFQAHKRHATQTYTLLQELQDKGRIKSLVLFTGTPHRGKDHGFLALMHLLRPDLFHPHRDMHEQLPSLRHAMIRNNKAQVTDLEGKRLFKPVKTETIDYVYSPEEEKFYHTMSNFILEGRTYALSFTGREQSARMLLLIALQKLAASSIVAIRHALERRRNMLLSAMKKTADELNEEAETLDDEAEAEEARPEKVALSLLQNEVEWLDELIDLSRDVHTETKICTLLDLIERRFPDNEPVLLFTEYKSTQAMVVAALEERFGQGCAGFINGEERLRIVHPDGREELRNLARDRAAADFNAGKTRFLVSTEAGGEGIDLQERCATLVHVDLPWNPMRLHQRVGRLNRYGQKRPVSVFLLRNPDTVEARIWELLEQKLARIQSALQVSMDEAEDISQLVIGMQGRHFLDEIFNEATEVVRTRGERLQDWFDARSGKLGGQDVMQTVRAMLGNASRYDFGNVGAQIPKIDLPALEPFFRNAMRLCKRRVSRTEEGLSVITPDEWKNSLELRPRYDGLVFDRELGEQERMIRLLGIGHPLLDRAIDEAVTRQVLLGRAAKLEKPLLIVALEDELTGTGTNVHRIVVALEADLHNPRQLADWEALLHLNSVQSEDSALESLSDEERQVINELIQRLPDLVRVENLPFRRPRMMPILALLPAPLKKAVATAA